MMISEDEKEKIIQVTREQEEFVQKVKLLLENDCVADAWGITTSVANKKLIENCSQELFQIISVYLREKEKCKTLTYEYCKSFVFQLTNDCQPEETFLELLEVAEKADLCGITIYLQAIQICLQKMPRKRGTSMAWVCNILIRFICDMELPKEIEDEQSDGCILDDKCSEAKDIYEMYSNIIDFFEPFINEIETEEFEVPENHQNEYKDVIHRCILKLLGRPLGYFDLNEAETPSKFRCLANRIIKMLSVFKFEPMYYLNYIDESCSVYDALSSLTVDADYSNLSLGIFYYLLFRHQIGIHKMSHVYSIEFLLEKMLLLSQDMISFRDAPIQLKATELLFYIFSRIQDKTVDLKSISFVVVAKFLEVLTSTMIYCDTKTLRQRSVELYKKFITKFTSEGQYMILMSLKKTDDPGLIGYGLTILKDLIADCLVTMDPEDMKQFTGNKLIWLLRIFCVLEERADLVRLSDRIISTLNLIRYLLIRDKDNCTGFSYYLDELEDTYLRPLKERLESARKEHIIEIDGLKKCEEQGKDSMSLRLFGGPDNMPISSQIKALDESITLLDLIESLYSRVMSFVESYKINNSKLTEIV